MRTHSLINAYLKASLFVQTVSSEYYIMNSSHVSWDYQKPPCHVASPEVVYSIYGPTVYLPAYMNISTDRKVFVGYTKSWIVFEYIGCAWLINDFFGKLKTYQIQSDPGQCYSVCQTTYIGLYDGYCYCLTDAPSDVQTNYRYCTTDCFFLSGTVCGGKLLGYNYISLYKYVNRSSTVNGLDDGRYCGTVDNGSYVWHDCYEQMKGNCANPSSKATSLTKHMSSWSQYTKECFTRRIQGLATDVTLGKTAVWVGRIRSFGIVNVQKLRQKTNYSYFGYISEQNNTYLLKFTQGLSGNVSVLCYAATEDEDTEDEIFSVAVGVYVIIPVAMIIAAVLLVLVIRWKRKHTTATRMTVYRAVYPNDTSLKQTTGRLATVANATDNSNPTSTTSQYANSAITTQSPRNPEENDYYNTRAIIHGATSDRHDGRINLVVADRQDHVYSEVELQYQTPARNDVGQTYDKTNAVLKVSAEGKGNLYDKLFEDTQL